MNIVLITFCQNYAIISSNLTISYFQRPSLNISKLKIAVFTSRNSAQGKMIKMCKLVFILSLQCHVILSWYHQIWQTYRVIFGNWYFSFDYHSGNINNFDTKVDSKCYWTWPILKMVLILLLALNLTEICKSQSQEEKYLKDIFNQKFYIFQK